MCMRLRNAMQLTMDISEHDVAEFGKDAIQREFENALKWIRIKQAFRNISTDLGAFDAQEYAQQIEIIRESAWNEYKQGLNL